MRHSLLILALLLLPFVAAHAETPQTNSDPLLAQAQPSTKSPDLLSFGLGYVDFDKSEPRTHEGELRLEYRWGYSLWGVQNSWLDFGIHPIAGGQASTRGQLYGFGGFAFDLLTWRHLVFTESEAVGLFDSGNAKPLGSFIEFRSMAELGWRFDNDVRTTVEISHISNAGLTKHNPGEETAGVYLHVPVSAIFSR